MSTAYDDSDAPRPIPLMRRSSVTALFDAGLRRIDGAANTPFRGALISEAGRSCRFELDLRGGIIERVQFRASPCISLITYCEWICQRLDGWPIDRGFLMNREDVIAAIPELRPERHLRADLALRALRSACVIGLSFEERFVGASRAANDCVAWSI